MTVPSAFAVTTATCRLAPNGRVDTVPDATTGALPSTARGPVERCDPAHTVRSTWAASRRAIHTDTESPATRRRMGPARTTGSAIGYRPISNIGRRVWCADAIRAPQFLP